MSNPYVGEIRIFAGNFAPNGWQFCQGQQLAISDNETLFNLIGTTYGGDGQTTFALPDLTSRIPIHQGRLTGGSFYALAQTGGQETVTLTQQQLPSHSHGVVASSSSATSPSPSGTVPAVWGDNQYSTSDPTVNMATTALSLAGGNQPHENMPPYLAVNFIISMFGIYPSPS